MLIENVLGKNDMMTYMNNYGLGSNDLPYAGSFKQKNSLANKIERSGIADIRSKNQMNDPSSEKPELLWKKR